jgi:hypothetical protein
MSEKIIKICGCRDCKHRHGTKFQGKNYHKCCLLDEDIINIDEFLDNCPLDSINFLFCNKCLKALGVER